MRLGSWTRDEEFGKLAFYFDRDRAFADLGLAPGRKAADRPD
jgi:hypothetical protein